MHAPVLNRQTLFSRLKDNSAVLVKSGEELIRNRDVEFPFRAHSDFFYLTGFSEPDALLLMSKIDGEERTTIFLRPKNLEQEIWQGRRLGVESAPATLQVDQAYSIEELDEWLPELLIGSEQLLVSFSDFSEWAEIIAPLIEQLKKQVRKGVDSPTTLFDLDVLLHEQRLIKNHREIELMRKAAQISVQGHLAAMAVAASANSERTVQIALENAFYQHGAQRVAFNSICASGENACILHYTENNAPLQSNALLLVDAGAEYHGYAGDITHTFPPSGKFSTEQAALYSLVLKAQQAVIQMIKPGVLYGDLHQTTLRILTAGLLDLGLLKGDLTTLVADKAYTEFFMHGTGHWLGMDVHDVGKYKIDGEWRPLEVGMVLTVEPGLYVSDRHQNVSAKWHNIGIRIEDDVLVTEKGCEVLTAGLPRTVAEIEQWFVEHSHK
ncbi:Xaa-Pro aminopeptidase [Thiosulfatimonas sediminis]|uniref:Xaa-Pro aminopeptidase n=1 Tax=Thiosulfatimonas sediminis TaxID=2675054 RepID=A0A6F8PU76_9GAMM|nr:aminopeptidase P N-terminal domain-containing protein [Thiosulfatimonas sediminis]BBP45675.1 Xaa-Pro aminopeptidase [Thiosulfatimonas sediminis]